MELREIEEKTDQEEIVPSFKDLYLAMQAKRAAGVETGTEAEEEDGEEEEEEEEEAKPAEAAEPDYVVVQPAQGAAKKRRRGGKRNRKSPKDLPATSDGSLSVKHYISDCVRQGISLDEAQRMWLARNRGIHDPSPAEPPTSLEKSVTASAAAAVPDDDAMSVSGMASSKMSSTRISCPKTGSWCSRLVAYPLFSKHTFLHTLVFSNTDLLTYPCFDLFTYPCFRLIPCCTPWHCTIAHNRDFFS